MSDTATPAPDAALPVTAATLLEDRARIERTTPAPVPLAAGAQRLRLGPVTPLAVDRSLRAEARSGPGGPDVTVVDARLVRARTPAPPDDPGADASALRRRVHDLADELRIEERRVQRAEGRLAVLAQARTELLREIAESTGWGDTDLPRWSEQSGAVEQQVGACEAELRRLQRSARGLREHRAEAERVLAAAEEAPPVLAAYVEVVVEAAAAGTAEIAVSHLVPCALWRPAYRAELRAGGTAVRVETDAVVWQRTGEDWTDIPLSFSTARPSLAADPPRLAEDELVLRDRPSEERHTVEVDLREEDIATVGAESDSAAGRAADELPGVDDGGEVRVLAARDAGTVPSDGRAHRVPVSVFDAEARTERACAPELSPVVGLVARFPNAAGHPLLAGPVELVRESGTTGRSELRFTGPDAEVRLPFGAEDAFRVVRSVEEERREPRLPGGKLTVRRTVRLFLSRLGGTGPALPVVVRERVPVSEVSAVDVAVAVDGGGPAPDADGITEWTVELPPSSHEALTLVYDVTATSRVRGL